MLRKFFLIGFLFVFPMAVQAAEQQPYSTDVSFLDLEGKPHKLSQYEGKWLVLNYWATWCPPCRAEIPDLIMFHEQHKDDKAVVVGVNVEDLPIADLKSFIDDNMMSYPVVVADNYQTPWGNIPGLPVTFLFRPDGSLAAQQTGMITAEAIESYINAQEAQSFLKR